MKEILDIVVHAILKIRSACGTSPQLKFVHQKEQSINPEQHYQQAIARTITELDKETMITAKLLKMESSVKCFADVIPIGQDRDFIKPLFVSQKQNSAYSLEYLMKVHQIKESLLLQLNKKGHQKQSFESIGKRIALLWDCLLQENFAFAFKNNAEIVAKMEVEQLFMKTLTEVDLKVEEARIKLSKEIKCEDESMLSSEISTQIDKLKMQMLSQVIEKLDQEIEQLARGNEVARFFATDVLSKMKKCIVNKCDEAKQELLDLNQEHNL